MAGYKMESEKFDRKKFVKKLMNDGSIEKHVILLKNVFCGVDEIDGQSVRQKTGCDTIGDYFERYQDDAILGYCLNTKTFDTKLFRLCLFDDGFEAYTTDESCRMIEEFNGKLYQNRYVLVMHYLFGEKYKEHYLKINPKGKSLFWDETKNDKDNVIDKMYDEIFGA